jgi:3-carboxy-cis,cis-muconate cycloisomerase
MSETLFGTLFTSADVDACLDDGAFLQAMLDTEAALAHACAHAGMIPASAAESIAACCQAEGFDAASIGRRAVAHASAVVPLVEDLRAAVPARFRPYVHAGATSQDVIDTALCLVSRAALARIAATLDAVAATLASLSRRHADDVQIGRTLLQHAQPTTFGLVCAGWLTGVDDTRRDLARIRDERLAVQLGGAVGNRSFYGPHGPAIAAEMADRLGLADPILPWHADRHRIGELAAAIAIASGTLATIGRNVALLAQTELGEVAECAPGGSSAMPYKRNPSRAVLVVATTQQIPGIATGVLAGMAGEAQRAIGTWQAEAPAVRQLLRLLGGAAEHTRVLLDGLRVDTERMRANVDRRPDIETAAAPVTDEMLAAARTLIDRALGASGERA